MAFFNPFRPSYLADPYPALARLRAAAPVHFSREFGAWVVSGYEQCAAVLRDYHTFTSERGRQRPDGAPWPDAEWRDAVWGSLPSLIDTDPPLHTRMRQLVNRSYTPAAVERLRPYIEQSARTRVAAAPVGEPFDVMAGLAKPLPLAVKMEHLGVAEHDREFVMAALDSLMVAMDPTSPPERVEQAGDARRELQDYFDRAGTVAALLGASGLPRDVLLSAMVDLSLGGNDDTAYGIGNAVLGLLTHPAQLALLREHPDLLASAVDELLRYDGPSESVIRLAAVDAVLAGQRIAAGVPIFVMSAGANRDPEQFAEPDRLDITRGDRRHLAFGRGVHYCLGAPLARAEIAAALRALLDRFSGLSLAEEEPPRTGNFVLRGPRRLMVVGRE